MSKKKHKLAIRDGIRAAWALFLPWVKKQAKALWEAIKGNKLGLLNLVVSLGILARVEIIDIKIDAIGNIVLATWLNLGGLAGILMDQLQNILDIVRGLPT